MPQWKPSRQSLLSLCLHLFLLLVSAPSRSVVEGSTSSVLLKHGIQKSLHTCTQRSTTTALKAAFVTQTGRRAVVTGTTGFLSFSHRATRLQAQLQKSFSLRAIVSDVITNYPGRQAPTAETTTTSTTEFTPDPLQLDQVATVSVRRRGPPRFRDLQRIATGTIQESWGGFVGGYLLGMTSEASRKLYSTVFQAPSVSAAATTTAGHVLPFPGLVRHSQQSLQMHSRSFHCGMEWAQMSAVFAASRLLVQSVRQKEDAWNTVAGSSLAGAIFACTSSPGRRPFLPPAAMARGALLYGGTMFLLHPHLWKQGIQMAMLTPPATSAKNTNASNHLPIWDGIQ